MDNILSQIIENNPEKKFITADGFDDAVIGLEEKSGRLIYSVDKCIEILEKNMSTEEALEFFDFNTRSSYVGELTPIWCDTF